MAAGLPPLRAPERAAVPAAARAGARARRRARLPRARAKDARARAADGHAAGTPPDAAKGAMGSQRARGQLRALLTRTHDALGKPRGEAHNVAPWLAGVGIAAAAACAMGYALFAFATSTLVTETYIARAAAAASAATGRTVKLGGIKGGGFLYLSLGPVEVSAAEHERSSAHVDELRVYWRPLASLQQWRAVFALELHGLLLHAVQAENRSWFGVPDDTSPVSSRDFLPFRGASITPDMLPERLREAERLRRREREWKEQWRNSSPSNEPLGVTVRSMGAALADILATQCTLAEVIVNRAVVKLHVFDEPADTPRTVRGIRVRADLRNTRDGAVDVTVDISLRLDERDPRVNKLTMRKATKRRTRRDPDTGKLLAERASPMSSEESASQQMPDAGEVARNSPTTLDDVPLGKGGEVNVLVKLSDPGPHVAAPATGEPRGELLVRVRARNVHAPVFERLLDIPIDFYDGRASGEVSIRSGPSVRGSQRTPSIHGKVALKDVDAHFFDAIDDVEGATGELMLDGYRGHLLGLKGRFGGVPVSAAGNFDLFEFMPPVARGAPSSEGTAPGSYRLHIDASATPLDTIRETFGAPPFPFPIAGAAAGSLSVSGALEKPVFTGSVWLVDSNKDEATRVVEDAAMAPLAWRRAVERVQCAARALWGEYGGSGAIAALDRVPLRSGQASIEVDTLAQEVRIESARIESAHGGIAHGRGRISTKPDAEVDPDAVEFEIEGASLPLAPLVLPYAESALLNSSGGFATPATDAAISALSASLSPLAPARAEAKVSGSLLAPKIDAEWRLGDGSASGEAHFSREAIAASADSPTLRVAGKLDVHLPNPLPVPARQAMTQLEATALGEPRLEGIHIDVGLKNFDGSAIAEMLLVPIAEDSHTASSPAGVEKVSKLLHSLQGPTGVLLNGDLSYHAEVSGPTSTEEDERDVEAALEAAVDAAAAASDAAEVWQEGINRVLRQGRADGDASMSNLRVNQLRITGEGMRGKASQDMSTGAVALNARGRRAEDRLELLVGLDDCPDAVAFNLRCGPLRVEAETQGGPLGAGKLRVRGLRFDDLQIASLSGNIEELSITATPSAMDVDADTFVETPMRRVIRGSLSVLQPRFGSVSGNKLTAQSTWDGARLDVESLRFTQPKSTYEASGGMVLPESALSGEGGWHATVRAAPSVDVEEMLPALSLASEFSKLAGTDDAAGALRDFALAKERFLQRVQSAGKAAAGATLNERLSSFLETVSKADAGPPTSTGAASTPPNASASTQGGLLQDLRGTWSGTLAASGALGAPGSDAEAFSVKEADFDVGGENWYVDREPTRDELRLERVALSGAWGSKAYPDGLHVRNLAVDCGEARLRASGDVFGPSQDARLVLMELPAEFVSHAFAGTGRRSSAPADALGRVEEAGTGTSAAASLPAVRPLSAAPLVSGPMYMQGELSGPQASPQARVSAQILDGSVHGVARLGPSRAIVTLIDGTRVAFEAELKPLDAAGSVCVKGSLPIVAKPLPGADSVDVRAEVVDGGMDLVAAMAAPGVVQWTGGSARLDLNVLGTVEKAIIEASARIRNGAVISPYLLHPARQLNVMAGVKKDRIAVETCDARIGRHGQFRVRGGLPLQEARGPTPEPAAAPAWSNARRSGRGKASDLTAAAAANALVAECQGVELRVPRALSAVVDSRVEIHGSAGSPELRGNVSLSQGSIFLHGLAAAAADADSAAPSEAAGIAKQLPMAAPQPGIALSNLSSALALRSDGSGGKRADGPAGVVCKGLRVKLGKQLRIIFPFVLNFGAKGELVVNGDTTSVENMRTKGTIVLENGDVNLLATQVRLAHDHIHFAAFDDEHPFDPLVDVRLVGPDLAVNVAGRASEWKDAMRIRQLNAAAYVPDASGDGTPDNGDNKEEMARALESRIAAGFGAAVRGRDSAENAQALGNLAMGTLAAMLPRLETTGEFPVGLGTWRVTSSPAAALGAIGPMDAGMPGGYALGLAEMEVLLGRSLRGTVALTGNDVGHLVSGVEPSASAARWTLLYRLNSMLRANLSGSSGGHSVFLIELSPKESQGGRLNL